MSAASRPPGARVTGVANTRGGELPGSSCLAPHDGAARAALSDGAAAVVVSAADAGRDPHARVELTGDTLRFDTLEPGRVLGTHVEVAGAALLGRWSALYPDDAFAPGETPAGLANVLVMRAYLAVVQPRPPGNVHAGLSITRLAPIPAGARTHTTVTCVGRHERSGRRFVEFSAQTRSDDGSSLVEARLTLIWAA